MGTLKAYGTDVTNVFQLIGNHENDITKSIAWAFCNCPVFTKKIFDELLSIDCDPENISIEYQSYEKNKGITDLEITDNNLFYAIIEAKRGWNLPGASQLSTYGDRTNLNKTLTQHKAIISMSECSIEYAYEFLSLKNIGTIPVKHLPWKRIYDIAKSSIAASNHAQKRLLSELIDYLGGIMTTQNI